VFTVGYLPSSWFRLGEDLPRDVAWEWRSWCLKQDYYRSFLGRTISKFYFDEVCFPIHFLYPDDDTIATDKTVESLKNFYPNAHTSVEKLIPSDFGLKKIGHFGLFSRSAKETLWPKVIEYFERNNS
jgi:predicted alpha/beta hydrolase